jgi:hypothetical protein
MSSALQNSKYQSCIEACNDCFGACEFCATECLREEEVKMMSKCISYVSTALISALQPLNSCQEIVNTQNRSAMFVLTYAMPAVLNVKNIRRWNTVNNALKHVEIVLRNVVKWRDKQKTEVTMTSLFSFSYILL